MEYRFLKDFGEIKAGEIGLLNDAWTVDEIAKALEDGMIEAVEIPEDADITLAKSDEAVSNGIVEETNELVRTYEGRAIIGDGFREVEGRKVRHIRLGDGSEYDLTEEDYQTKIKTS